MAAALVAKLMGSHRNATGRGSGFQASIRIPQDPAPPYLTACPGTALGCSRVSAFQARRVAALNHQRIAAFSLSAFRKKHIRLFDPASEWLVIYSSRERHPANDARLDTTGAGCLTVWPIQVYGACVHGEVLTTGFSVRRRLLETPDSYVGL
jgi:hypothetical protein